jgi:hypothetical protein
VTQSKAFIADIKSYAPMELLRSPHTLSSLSDAGPEVVRARIGEGKLDIT